MLEIKNLYYKYSGTHDYALSDINLSFDKGIFYAIAGPSGSGKTTLISMISGMEAPTEGYILYNGVNINKMNLDSYRAVMIGVIFQSYNLILTMTARENVELSLYLAGIRSRMQINAYALLDQVGIDKYKADRKILKLSGGEQQRVAIARAIAGSPDIIIADEPTGNLDSVNAVMIMDILHDFAVKEKKCVIVVSHSDIIKEYTDVIIHINDGKIKT